MSEAKMGTSITGTTETEARAEAQRIVTYWHNLGYTQVRATIHPYTVRKGGELIYGYKVKSNLDKRGNPVGAQVINLKKDRK